MNPKRLQLFHYDVVRELCECSRETFHFVPPGTSASTRQCARCGNEGRIADLSDTSLFRLVTRDDGEVVIVPLMG